MKQLSENKNRMKCLKHFSISVKKKLIRFLTVLLVISYIASPAAAFGNAVETNQNKGSILDESIKTGELQRFVDETFKKNMQHYNIPGAAISIVKDGKLIISKGYGYADMEKKIPVDPNKTQFRIGSVTKLFTANAIIQLVENGKIDLNSDVNKYLKGFRISNSYSKPITMAQLLTHTSGIDSDVIGDLSQTESEVKPLSQFLQKRMLPVVREPGRSIQYSSYGIALAGCILEEVSGTYCSEYINKNIFVPLGMDNSNMKMNTPGLAKGYTIINGSIQHHELKGYFNLYPVGGIISTAEDMAKFMIAHLNNGEYNGNRILKTVTARDMHSRHAGFASTLPGTCYGFHERFRNGQRAISHPGYSPDGFSTELSLLPDYNIGIFISVNQGSNNSFPQDFVDEFIDSFISAKENNSDKSTLKIVTDKNIEGTYRFSDYTKSTLNKADIFGNGEDVKVTVNKDGTITLNEIDPFTRNKAASTAIQVEPMVFKNADGEYVVFKKDSKGKAAYMAQTSNSWHGTYERIHWYEENAFQVGLFIFCLAVFLLEAGLWIALCVIDIVKRHKAIAPASKSVRISWLLAGLGSLLNIAFFVISMLTWGERLRYGVPLDIKLLLCIPIITSLTAVVLSVVSGINWSKSLGSLFFRINTSMAAIVGLIFIWFYNYWNLLGFRY